MTVMGIDAGGYETKVCVNGKVYSFPSDIGEYRTLRIAENFSRDDMIWEYKGERGFAGTLAKYESEYGGCIRGRSKAHEEVTLRILLAIHRHGGDINQIVVGQPIDTHVPKEKDEIKRMLLGEHIIKVNNVEKKIIIDKVEVAAEGASAWISYPINGLIRIVDIGSGTTNFATINDRRKIDKDSFTRKIGMEIMLNSDPKEIAKGIYRQITQKWSKHDKILFTGGGAEKVFKYLEGKLLNSEVLKPKLNDSVMQTKFANVIGFYTIAKGVYKNEEHEKGSNSIQPQ